MDVTVDSLDASLDEMRRASLLSISVSLTTVGTGAVRNRILPSEVRKFYLI